MVFTADILVCVALQRPSAQAIVKSSTTRAGPLMFCDLSPRATSMVMNKFWMALKFSGKMMKEFPQPKTLKDVLHLVWLSLLEIMNRPWWHQIWRPKCVLPKEVIVCCGAVSTPWEVISLAARYFQNHKPCCLNALAGRYGSELFEEFRILNRVRYNIQRTSNIPLCKDHPTCSS